MVKQQEKDSRKSLASKQFNNDCGRARKINASTEVETCGEQLSPFGGLLGLVKFLCNIGDAHQYINTVRSYSNYSSIFQ